MIVCSNSNHTICWREKIIYTIELYTIIRIKYKIQIKVCIKWLTINKYSDIIGNIKKKPLMFTRQKGFLGKNGITSTVLSIYRTDPNESILYLTTYSIHQFEFNGKSADIISTIIFITEKIEHEETQDIYRFLLPIAVWQVDIFYQFQRQYTCGGI